MIFFDVSDVEIGGIFSQTKDTNTLITEDFIKIRNSSL
jgi:hypothetical protein